MFLCQDTNQSERADVELAELQSQAQAMYRQANHLLGNFWGVVFSRRGGRTPQQVVDEMRGRAGECFRSMELICKFLGAVHELTADQVGAPAGVKVKTAPPVVPPGWRYRINPGLGTVKLEEIPEQPERRFGENVRAA